MSARSLPTAAQVAAVKDDGVHWVAPSLYLQVRAAQGTRSWLFSHSRNDTNQWMGLGSSRRSPSPKRETTLLRSALKNTSLYKIGAGRSEPSYETLALGALGIDQLKTCKKQTDITRTCQSSCEVKPTTRKVLP